MRIFFPLLSLFFFFSCQNEKATTQSSSASKYLKISGQTMGTTYHITYLDSLGRNFKPTIDSLLVVINHGVSTYEKDSDITRFNENRDLEFLGDDIFKNYFIEVMNASYDIFEKTDGYFDPTVMPLVNYWGFGYQEKKPVTQIDSVKVDSLQKLVGLEKIKRNCDGKYTGYNCKYEKENPNIKVDFSAIAKGYAVDLVSLFLEEKNIENYFVEIGGEIKTQGKNPKSKLWTSAISTPKINAKLRDYEAIVQLDNKAIATSGNYRNFYEVNGDWYGHEINPKTGFPEKSKLLSVSVLADECMYADAYATAFMVMGLEKSKALLEQLKDIDAFFIFANEKGELEQSYTSGFEGYVLK